MAVRAKVLDVLSDKLFVSHALDTASCCNESGHEVYLYVQKFMVGRNILFKSEIKPSGGILPLVLIFLFHQKFLKITSSESFCFPECPHLLVQFCSFKVRILII